ncbi:MAG: hypothetical protein RQ875_05410 [Vicingaceae bacterium]|nr:hypothetical protein [Vicingaceae bacterium]
MVKNLIKQEMLLYLDRYKILILIGCMLFESSFFAQMLPKEENQLWIKANKAFDLGDFLSAKMGYDELIKTDSINEELNFKLGVVNYELKRYKSAAKQNFSRVNPLKFPETYYYLALIAHSEEKFDEAIINFKIYKKSKYRIHSKKDIDFLIDKSKYATTLEDNLNSEIELVNLGNNVNSEYDDFSPLLSIDEDYLLFTSRRENEIFKEQNAYGDYFENIYITKQNGDNWTTPTLLDTTINTRYNESCTGLSVDGKQLLLFRTSDDLKSGDIYESNYINNEWTIPVKLSEVVNSEGNKETSACYLPSGNAIIFSSDRPGGYGGKDLYMVKRLPNNQWGEPFNLGSTINTPYDEDAPFVHPVENVLFFSSKSHENMGGYDIFQSVYNYESGSFETPINLGKPINTVNDDMFFVLNKDATKGFLSSERVDGLGMQDIYEVEFNGLPKNLMVYHVNFLNEMEELVNEVEVQLYTIKKNKNKMYGKYKTNAHNGKMVIVTNPNKEYQLKIVAKGYEEKTFNVFFDKSQYLTFRLAKSN